jgi:MYXO-CTERM domain-containing protein
MNGLCGEPTGTGGGGTGGGQSGTGGAVIQGGSGNNGNGGNAGVVVVGGNGATGQGGSKGDTSGSSAPKGDPGCACRAGRPGGRGLLFYGAIGLAVALFRRRRARGH